MPAARQQPLLDGSFVDPADRYTCHIFEAVAAIALPEIIGGVVGGLGGIGEAVVGGLGGALGGIGDVIGGVVGGLGGLGDVLGFGGGLGEAIGGGAGELGGLFGAAGPITIEPLAGAALPAGETLGAVGPALAASPAAPAGVAELGAATTGNFGSAIGGLGGGGPVGGNVLGAGGATAGADLTAADFSTALGESLGSATPGAGSGGGGLFDKAISGLTGGALNKSDLGTLLSIGGLGMNLMNRNQTMPGERELGQSAASLRATAQGQTALGHQLQSFLQSGKLPPGLEKGVRSATNAAKASIKSQHASRGTAGSSAEAADLQAAEDRSLEASQKVALGLLQQGSALVAQGASTEGFSAALYNELMREALARDNALGSAIGSFASALAGSPGTKKAA